MLRYVIPAQRKNLILAKHVTLVPDIMIAAGLGNIVPVQPVLRIVPNVRFLASVTIFRILVAIHPIVMVYIVVAIVL